jgi:hypothetical protein
VLLSPKHKRPELPHNDIIIIYIQKEYYAFEELCTDFFWVFTGSRCPACRITGFLRKHAKYKKYYYNELIQILRCICKICGTTHALIPFFSLPGCSTGTLETENYLELRTQGLGRRRAGKELVGGKGMNESYPYFLDEALKKAVARAKEFTPGDSRLAGIAWIRSVTGQEDHPILSLNQYCLDHGVNAVCFTRYSILIFRNSKEGKEIPHNTRSRRMEKVVIDSW